MRLARMFSLAAIGAVAVTAFIGVGSASAVHLVVVCLENPTGLCPKGKLKEAGAGLPILGKLEALNGGSVHTILLGSVEPLCTGSDIKGQITKSSPLHGVINEVTFSGCKTCKKVEALNLPYLASFHHDLNEEHPWSMLVKSVNQADILIDLKECPLGVECAYKTASLRLYVSNTEAGLPLALSVEAEFIRETGALCPAKAFWDANYLVEILHGDILEKGWLALDEKES